MTSAASVNRVPLPIRPQIQALLLGKRSQSASHRPSASRQFSKDDLSVMCQKQTASWLRASADNVSKENSTDSFGNNPLTRNARTGSVTPSRKTAAGPALPPVPFPMASSPSTKKASGFPSTEARIVPDLGSGDHDNCMRPFFVSVLHVATSRYKPGTPSFLAAAIYRRTDAVTSCAPPATVHSFEPADAKTSAAISPCLVA